MIEINLEKLVRVSIVEDDDSLRNGIIAVLKSNENFMIIGSYPSCEKAFEDPKLENSDIVIMDISLPGMNGIEGVKYISGKYPDILIIMLTIHDDDDYIFDAVRNGAVGYLLKSTSPDLLIKAIYDAREGGSPMTPKVARKVLQAFHGVKEKSAENFNLIDREKEILSHLADGKSYKEIANILFLSPHTINYHLRHIYEKLQVKTRAEAVATAHKKNLI